MAKEKTSLGEIGVELPNFSSIKGRSVGHYIGKSQVSMSDGGCNFELLTFWQTSKAHNSVKSHFTP